MRRRWLQRLWKAWPRGRIKFLAATTTMTTTTTMSSADRYPGARLSKTTIPNRRNRVSEIWRRLLVALADLRKGTVNIYEMGRTWEGVGDRHGAWA